MKKRKTKLNRVTRSRTICLKRILKKIRLMKLSILITKLSLKFGYVFIKKRKSVCVNGCV